MTYTCVICWYDEVPPDDARAPKGGRCICLACWTRETEERITVPRDLQRLVERALTEVDPLTADFFKPGGR